MYIAAAPFQVADRNEHRTPYERSVDGERVLSRTPCCISRRESRPSEEEPGEPGSFVGCTATLPTSAPRHRHCSNFRERSLKGSSVACFARVAPRYAPRGPVRCRGRFRLHDAIVRMTIRWITGCTGPGADHVHAGARAVGLLVKSPADAHLALATRCKFALFPTTLIQGVKNVNSHFMRNLICFWLGCDVRL